MLSKIHMVHSGKCNPQSAQKIAPRTMKLKMSAEISQKLSLIARVRQVARVHSRRDQPQRDQSTELICFDNFAAY
jgi:hypothetical protein